MTSQTLNFTPERNLCLKGSKLKSFLCYARMVSLTSNTLCDPVNIETFDALTHASLHTLWKASSPKRRLIVKCIPCLRLKSLKTRPCSAAHTRIGQIWEVPPRNFVIVNVVEVVSNSMHLYFSVISLILQLSNSLLKTLKIYSNKKKIYFYLRL